MNCYGYREEKGYYRAGHNFDILRDIPQQLNAEYALLAVKMNGSALKHVTNKTNLITMEALMENGYQAFQYATETQKKTKDQNKKKYAYTYQYEYGSAEYLQIYGYE